MNLQVKSMLESTYGLIAGALQDPLKGWDHFLEFVAVENSTDVITQLDHKFEWLFEDRSLAKKVLSTFDFQLLKSDQYDHLGEIYFGKVAYSPSQRSAYLIPQYAVESRVRSEIPYTRKVISIFDPDVGTGRRLIAASKQAPNAILFGTTENIRLARIAMTNLHIHNLRGFILCANPAIHELDLETEKGRKNWSNANKWHSRAPYLVKHTPRSSSAVNSSIGDSWIKTLSR